MIELDPNADVVNFQELATKLIAYINDYYDEWTRMENEGNPDADYFAGLISGYSTVATLIGVSTEKYAPFVSEIC